jgi:hypothetical protein
VLRSRGPDGIEEAVAVLTAAITALTTPRTADAQRVTAQRASTVRDLDQRLREGFPDRFDGGPPHWSVDARLYLEYAWDAADSAAPAIVPRHLAAVQAVELKNGLGPSVTGVVSAALLFYVLTIAGVFRLRASRPEVERPYRAFGYPVIPALYIVGALTILGVLLIYRPATTWPGFVIVLLGIPVFLAMRRPPSR